MKRTGKRKDPLAFVQPSSPRAPPPQEGWLSFLSKHQQDYLGDTDENWFHCPVALLDSSTRSNTVGKQTENAGRPSNGAVDTDDEDDLIDGANRILPVETCPITGAASHLGSHEDGDPSDQSVVGVMRKPIFKRRPKNSPQKRKTDGAGSQLTETGCGVTPDQCRVSQPHRSTSLDVTTPTLSWDPMGAKFSLTKALFMTPGVSTGKDQDRTLAKSLGIDPSASVMSWTSSLATPPGTVSRANLSLINSRDEGRVSADTKIHGTAARALFSPGDLLHCDEELTMESLQDEEEEQRSSKMSRYTSRGTAMTHSHLMEPSELSESYDGVRILSSNTQQETSVNWKQAKNRRILLTSEDRLHSTPKSSISECTIIPVPNVDEKLISANQNCIDGSNLEMDSLGGSLRKTVSIPDQLENVPISSDSMKSSKKDSQGSDTMENFLTMMVNSTPKGNSCRRRSIPRRMKLSIQDGEELDPFVLSPLFNSQSKKRKFSKGVSKSFTGHCQSERVLTSENIDRNSSVNIVADGADEKRVHQSCQSQRTADKVRIPSREDRIKLGQVDKVAITRIDARKEIVSELKSPETCFELFSQMSPDSLHAMCSAADQSEGSQSVASPGSDKYLVVEASEGVNTAMLTPKRILEDDYRTELNGSYKRMKFDKTEINEIDNSHDISRLGSAGVVQTDFNRQENLFTQIPSQIFEKALDPQNIIQENLISKPACADIHVVSTTKDPMKNDSATTPMLEAVLVTMVTSHVLGAKNVVNQNEQSPSQPKISRPADSSLNNQKSRKAANQKTRKFGLLGSKNFSYPTFSQITDTCPKKVFNFGGSNESGDTPAHGSGDSSTISKQADVRLDNCTSVVGSHHASPQAPGIQRPRDITNLPQSNAPKDRKPPWKHKSPGFTTLTAYNRKIGDSGLSTVSTHTAPDRPKVPVPGNPSNDGMKNMPLLMQPEPGSGTNVKGQSSSLKNPSFRSLPSISHLGETSVSNSNLPLLGSDDGNQTKQIALDKTNVPSNDTNPRRELSDLESSNTRIVNDLPLPTKHQSSADFDHMTHVTEVTEQDQEEAEDLLGEFREQLLVDMQFTQARTIEQSPEVNHEGANEGVSPEGTTDIPEPIVEYSVMKRDEISCPSFKTAGGKGIHISEEARMKAENLVADLSDPDHHQAVLIAEKLDLLKPIETKTSSGVRPQPTHLPDATGTDSHTYLGEHKESLLMKEIATSTGFAGFQSASGKALAVKMENINKYQKWLDDSQDDLTESIKTPILAAAENAGTHKDENASRYEGFKSASGKTLTIDNATMSKFCKWLEDEDSHHVSEKTQEQLGQLLNHQSVPDNHCNTSTRDKNMKDLLELPKGYRPFKPPQMLTKISTKHAEDSEIFNTANMDTTGIPLHMEADEENIDGNAGLNGEQKKNTSQNLTDGLHDSNITCITNKLQGIKTEVQKSVCVTEECNHNTHDTSADTNRPHSLQHVHREIRTISIPSEHTGTCTDNMDNVETKPLTESQVNEVCWSTADFLQHDASFTQLEFSPTRSGSALHSMKAPSNTRAMDHDTSGFQTAAGQKVTVSNEAICKAKCLLDSVDMSDLPPADASLCQQNLSPDKHEPIPAKFSDVDFPNKLDHSWEDDRQYTTCEKTSVIPDNVRQGDEAPLATNTSNAFPEQGVSDNMCKSSHTQNDKFTGDTIFNEEIDVVGLAFNNASHDKAGNFEGFKTASGSKIAVSNAAMGKARQIFQEECPEQCNPSVPVGFNDNREHGEGKPTDLSLIGFQTARGIPVHITVSALEKARHILGDVADTDETPKHEIRVLPCGFSPKAEDSPSHKSSNISSRYSPSKDVAQEKPFMGFQTAKGNKVNISNEALIKARGILDQEVENDQSKLNEDFETSEMSTSDKFNRSSNSDTKTSVVDHLHDVDPTYLQSDTFSQETLEQTSVSKDVEKFAQLDEQAGTSDAQSAKACIKFKGFQTALGENVSVSTRSLKMVKKLFSDSGQLDSSLGNIGVDLGTKSLCTTGFSGFKTAKGKNVAISAEAVKQAKNLLENDDISEIISLQNEANGIGTYEKDSDSSAFQSAHVSACVPFKGFQTASGNTVTVSNDALESAKSLLETDKTHETDALSSKSYSSDTYLIRPSLENINIVQPEIPSTKKGSSELTNLGKFAGFQTAKGNCVTVSKKALDAAKVLLETDGFHGNRQGNSENISETENPGNVSVVQCKLSNTKNDTSEQTHLSRFAGFQTAKGNSVTVSKQALDAAKALLETEDISGHQQGSYENVTGNTVDETRPTQGFGGFLSAKGNDVSVSAGSLTAVRKLLADVPAPVTTPVQAKRNECSDRLKKHATETGTSEVNFSQEAMESTKALLADGDFEDIEWNSPVSNDQCQEHKPDNRKEALQRQQPLPNPNVHTRKSHQKTPSESPQFSTPYKRKRETPVASSFTTPLKKPFSYHCSERKVENEVNRKDTSSPLEKCVPLAEILPDTPIAISKVYVKYKDIKIPQETKRSRLKAKVSQGQRIAQKKKAGDTKPVGGEHHQKKSSGIKITLKELFQGHRPQSFTSQQLHVLGVKHMTTHIKAANAEEFRFHVMDFYGPEAAKKWEGVKMGDEGYIVFGDDSTIGKEEFCNALLDMPGVEPKLICREWVYNHFKWVVWKLAAMEVAFPHTFGGRHLTPSNVMLQLKYRYDREVDHSHRSALKKIYEQDDSPQKPLVLCVSRVLGLPSPSTTQPRTPREPRSYTEPGQVFLELTDGWYAIKAVLDKPLTQLAVTGRIRVGDKLCTYGADFVAAHEPCPPLQASGDIMLKLNANSTRRARWYARLGYCPCPQPCPVPLGSLFPEGGVVGCVDVMVTRVYPMQYLEKSKDGASVWRCSRGEEITAQRFARGHQQQMERMYQEVEEQVKKDLLGNKEKNKVSNKRWTAKALAALQDGSDLCDAITEAVDPSSIEMMLSSSQQVALSAYRQQRQDVLQQDIQAEIQRKIADTQTKQPMSRTVIPALKVRLAGCTTQDIDTAYSAMLTVWRPPEDISSLLSEGHRLRIYNLATGSPRGPGASTYSLSTARNTRYERVLVDDNFRDLVYEPREITAYTEMNSNFRPPNNELDTVGVVVRVSEISTFDKQNGDEGRVQTLYLADADHHILSVKLWGGLSGHYLDDVVHDRVYLACSNLQWRPDHGVAWPCTVVSDCTHLSTKPRETHLQTGLDHLQHKIKDVKLYVANMKMKISDILHSRNEGYQSKTPLLLPRRQSFDPRMFVNNPKSSEVRFSSPQIDSRNRMGFQHGIQSGIRQTPLVHTKSELKETEEECSQNRISVQVEDVKPSTVPCDPVAIALSASEADLDVDPASAKKKLLQKSKADKLERFDLGPDVSDLNSPIPRAVRRAFKPPTPRLPGESLSKPRCSVRGRRKGMARKMQASCKTPTDQVDANVTASHSVTESMLEREGDGKIQNDTWKPGKEGGESLTPALQQEPTAVNKDTAGNSNGESTGVDNTSINKLTVEVTDMTESVESVSPHPALTGPITRKRKASENASGTDSECASQKRRKSLRLSKK